MLKRRHFLKLSALFGAGAAASALLPGCATVAAPVRKPVVMDIVRDRGALFRETDEGLIENTYTLKVINKSQL